MTSPRPELHAVDDAPPAPSTEDLLAGILAELQALNAAILPMAEMAAKRFPFTFGFGNARR